MILLYRGIQVKVTIILPVYNKDKYLENTLEQIRNQTFKDFECIMVDDGSTDNSGKICDEFVKKDSRFKVFHIKNDGVSHARNVALDKAQGEYITFIDGDDEIYPQYIENLVSCLELNNADFVIGGYEIFWDNNETLEYRLYDGENKLYTMEELLKTFAEDQKKNGIYGYCCGKLFKSSLAENVRFDENLKLAEDFDFYLKIYAKINTIYLDDKTYYRYRQEAANSSFKVLDDRIDYMAQLKINLRYRDFLKSKGVFTADNKEIVTGRINDYVYFSLFHCPKDKLSERFDELKKICRDENIALNGNGAMQRIILSSLKHNFKFGVKAVLSIYRGLRALKNKIR